MASKEKKYTFPPKDEEEISMGLDMQGSIYRGKIIHYMINLEEMTEKLIIQHYFSYPENPLHPKSRKIQISPKKSSEFMGSITSNKGFPFMFKYDALIFILRNYYPNFIDKKPYFAPVFQTLIETRNVFAHHKFAYNVKPSETQVLFQHPSTKDNKIRHKRTLVDDEYMRKFYGEYSIIYNDLKTLRTLIEWA